VSACGRVAWRERPAPNLNAELRLPSVHTYDSLSSPRYHALIRALGGEVQTYGRYNSTIKRGVLDE
jgi:hypothetical protein